MSLTKLERNLLDFFHEHAGSYYKPQDLGELFNYRGHKNFKRLLKALNFLDHIGEIELNQYGKYGLAAQAQERFQTGIFRANAKGFGFVTVDEEQPDLFIPPGKTGGALNGDQVQIEILKAVNPATGKGSEARVTQIIEHATTQLIGEFTAYTPKQQAKFQAIGQVKPQTTATEPLTIQILADGGIHPADHSLVIVKIVDYPTADNPTHLTGLVAKEIGHRDAPGVDILAVLYEYGIPHEFPELVKEAVKQIPDHVTSAEMADRLDLRDELIFTIDGADAKDLDDAISIKQLDNGHYQLGVHIADVSHYVTAGSPIDREAYERGTSVYLADRVVPMLPEQLSNGICSLHAHVDRLAKSCLMTINASGKVVDYSIQPTVIHSHYRMTYQDVNAIYAGDPIVREKYPELVTPLEQMRELHQILHQKRHRRGAIDFDSQEAKIIVDEEGQPIDIELRERGIGERMIESFMLAANETVADHFTRLELPFLYRTHGAPDSDRIDQFAQFVTAFGLMLRGRTEDIEPKQLQTLLQQAQDEPYEPIVSMMLLRSMQQAVYSSDPEGHFGLAARDYTHFTSPIRRYPDLMVHRLITRYASGRPKQKDLTRIASDLPAIADQASKRERRAIEAEREVEAMKKAEYMEQFIGEEFDGHISSITGFGLFVQLPNTIEGLIRLDQIKGDYYQFNQAHLMLVGERTGRVFKIGQAVRIQVAAVDVAERQIDFDLVSAEEVTAEPRLIEQTQRQGKRGGRRKQKGRSQTDGSRSGQKGNKGNKSSSQRKQNQKNRRKKRRKQSHSGKSFTMKQRQK